MADPIAADRKVRVATGGQPDPIGDALLADILAAVDASIEVAEYLFGRAHCVADADIRHARAHGVSVYDYTNCKLIEVSDEDIFEAAGAGINVWDYQGFRFDGLSHEQILEYFTVAGAERSAHVELAVVLGGGGTFGEMMEALAAGWRPEDYGPLREGGGSHEWAMAELRGARSDIEPSCPPK